MDVGVQVRASVERGVFVGAGATSRTLVCEGTAVLVGVLCFTYATSRSSEVGVGAQPASKDSGRRNRKDNLI